MENPTTKTDAGVNEEQYYGEPPAISQDWLDKQYVENPDRFKCYTPYIESISEHADWDDDRSVYQAEKAPYDITERIHMTINDHIDVLKQLVQAGEYRFDHHNNPNQKMRASDISVVDLVSTDSREQTWYAGMVKEPPTDPFKKAMEQLKCKNITPLMTSEDIQFARAILQAARAKGAFYLTKAKDTYFDRTAEGLLCLVLARWNEATPASIRAIVRDTLPPQEAFKFEAQFAKLTRQANEARNQSLAFFKGAITCIVNAFNLAAGCKLFHTLTHEQREEVFEAVFNQYPLWTVLQFQPKGQRAVDFDQLFAYNSADRKYLQSFYKCMFVEMCEAANTTIIKYKLKDRAATNSLKKYWERFPRLNYIQRMYLGGEMDLPCVPRDVGKARTKKVAPAADDFDSGDEVLEEDGEEFDGEW